MRRTNLTFLAAAVKLLLICRQRRVFFGFLSVLSVIALVGGCKNAQRVAPIPGRGPGTVDSPPGLAPSVPGSLPAPHEELWVISRTRSISNPSGEPLPGSGSMEIEVEHKKIPMPLKHTDVQASISGCIATVKVLQQFHNPYDHKIEAVYVFPLVENAAVNEFIMTIGERRIRGIIREREEAERVYAEAKRQGYVASLLTQERPNIFTQSIANLEPGQAIDVTIQYFHTLAYSDGWYEFVFPMVVGPRFNPPGSTGGVGAVARDAADVSGQKTVVRYLAPHERSGHDIALALDIHAGVEIAETVCRSHEVAVQKPSPDRTITRLSPRDSIPNKDFVLRYRVAGERIQSSLLTHGDERGGFFTLLIYPPVELQSLSRQPLELVFVLDCSGSMNGEPIAQAKAAVKHGLQQLRSGDSFQLINFSTCASRLGPKPLEATPRNIRRGLDYLRALDGEGGTMMIEGIRAALDFPHDPERLRFVVFLTDGYIGNEAEILGEVQRRIGAARIFSFGVGSSPNRYLLDGMAKLGRGAVAYLGLKDDAVTVMDEFFDRISHPALTDVQVDWGGAAVEEVFPARVPDLFVGRPVILTGRFRGKHLPETLVSGNAGSQRVAIPVPSSATINPALPSVWARMKIAALSDRSLLDNQHGFEADIKRVALDYNLMSAFTAFVAVDSLTQTTGSAGAVTPVAVPVPEGVNYKTTVQE